MSASIASSVVGGIFGKKSADKQADASIQSQQMALDYAREAEDRARADIDQYYKPAIDQRQQAYQRTMDFYSNAFPSQMRMSQQGNINAQQTTADATANMYNALMGLPVSNDFMAPKSVAIEQPIQDILSGLPRFIPDGANTYQPLNEQVTRTVTSPQGNLNEFMADGSRTIYVDNGNVHRVQRDGSRVITMPDGRVRTVSADGRVVVKDADGNILYQGDSEAQQPDQQQLNIAQMLAGTNNPRGF